MTDDNGSVGIAEDDLCAHVNQFVDKEQSTLEHLLMEEYASACLSSYND